MDFIFFRVVLGLQQNWVRNTVSIYLWPHTDITYPNSNILPYIGTFDCNQWTYIDTTLCVCLCVCFNETEFLTMFSFDI